MPDRVNAPFSSVEVVFAVHDALTLAPAIPSPPCKRTTPVRSLSCAVRTPESSMDIVTLCLTGNGPLSRGKWPCFLTVTTAHPDAQLASTSKGYLNLVSSERRHTLHVPAISESITLGA